MKKVKVALYSDQRHFVIIEVNEDEVEKVKEINRMIWRETKMEERHIKKLKEEGITICSLESIEEDGECIADYTIVDPMEEIIAECEHEENKALVASALECLTKKQREVIVKYYFEEKSLREIADDLGLIHSTVQEQLNQGLKKLKKYLENQ